MATTPYIYFKFLGINSFIKTLEDSDTEYTLYDEQYECLFNKYNGILSKEDTLKTGILSRDGQHVFFTEVGIKITKSYSSYFIYIFDHHPVEDDIDFIINGLESLINENIDRIDPSEIAANIPDTKKGGHLIN
ncbi:MAG TPA: hypothetical protein PKG60_04325 [Spirochaetota bacterium]|nr:hypothetical protein [Spirochaetota bacterium]HPS87968.1 hypothetical protein [Spirochaetota bacterium]